MSTVQFVSNDLIDRAKKLSSTLLADVMGSTGAMDHQIKPVARGMNIVGTAFTVSLRYQGIIYFFIKRSTLRKKEMY
nr:hypothetical protein P5627_05095 [Bacillus safensis]